ncbi:Hsp33 family molecular chaperone HslO [Acidaminobacterium chupaoyuni]
MADSLIRGMTKDGMVKFSAVQCTEAVERARKIHNTLPLATAALGRTLAAASMMGNMLKSVDGSVTIQIRGGGPLGTITAVGDCSGNMRGYLQNPAVALPLRPDGKLDVGAGVGSDGILTVIKDIGAREPFAGKVQMRTGEIAEDLAAYFVESEQIPTVCALGVLVGRDQSVQAAGGYLIQLMPGATDAVIDRLESSVQKLRSVTTMLEAGMSVEEMMREALAGFEVEILETQPVAYECKCSRHKVESALISMGAEELLHMEESGEDAQVTCQFCDAVYAFTPMQLKDLRRKAEKKKNSQEEK